VSSPSADTTGRQVVGRRRARTRALPGAWSASAWELGASVLFRGDLGWRYDKERAFVVTYGYPLDRSAQWPGSYWQVCDDHMFWF
jgi:hypothetical protein